jgi:CBS domain-containing protein
MLARDVMSQPVVTVRASTSIVEAAKILTANGFTALPVVDDDRRLVGIVTEADLIRDRVPGDPRTHSWQIRARRSEPNRVPVSEVMSTPVESLTAGADVADAARMMVDDRIRCLPIVDGPEVVGIVTRRDVLRAAVANNDRDLEAEISRQLAYVDNSERWTVSVQAGVADIEDYGTDPVGRELAGRAASSLPGVVQVQTRHQTPDPF